MNTDHPQVPFTTIYGEEVEVDEGLYEILEAFKRLDVVTMASCQNNYGQGYISALRDGMNSFLKSMFSNYESKGYSEKVHKFIKGFETGFKLTEFAIFTNKGTHHFPLYTSTKGVHDPVGYQIEYYFRNDKVPYIVIRWPYYHNETFLQLLQEMHA